MRTNSNHRLERKRRLMPNDIPRWIRVYDHHESYDTIDRYTVVFTGNYNNIGHARNTPRLRTECIHPYISMSDMPTHPLGFCQHGETEFHCIDYPDSRRWPPAIGRKHANDAIGRRIPFEDLPTACQAIVRSDYKSLWELE